MSWCVVASLFESAHVLFVRSAFQRIMRLAPISSGSPSDSCKIEKNLVEPRFNNKESERIGWIKTSEYDLKLALIYPVRSEPNNKDLTSAQTVVKIKKER